MFIEKNNNKPFMVIIKETNKIKKEDT